MKSLGVAGAFVFGAVVLSGCGTAQIQGTPVRVHTTTAAFAQQVSARDDVKQRTKELRKESPLVRACKSGSSKSCNELGDRLMIKHAYSDARQWYAASCQRLSGSMVPTATRLMQLTQELTQLSSMRGVDDETAATHQKKQQSLKADIAEIRAQIQGCLDTGETLKLDSEPKQSIKYYDAVCEFSVLVDAVGEAAPGLERATESGCAGGEAARQESGSKAQFAPQLFVELAKKPAKQQSAPAADEGMVFNEGDL